MKLSVIWETLKRAVGHSPAATGIFIIAFGYGISHIRESWQSAGLELLALMVLYWLWAWRMLYELSLQPLTAIPQRCKNFSWLLVILAFGAALFPPLGDSSGIMALISFLVALSAMIYRKGWSGFVAVPALLLGLVVLPWRDGLLLGLSYPLRLAAADMGCALATIFGATAYHVGTMVMIGEERIAITSGCSGINQVEGLMLFTAILNWILGGRGFARWIGGMTVLPALLFSNALRIALIIGGYSWIGPDILVGKWHDGLGWLQLCVCCVMIFFGVVVSQYALSPQPPPVANIPEGAQG